MRKMLTVAGVILMFLASVAQSQENKIAFPKDYKNTYTNYLNLDRVQNPDQVIRLYANDVAMQGPGPDGKLPYGSILVGEVYKAKKDAEGNVVTSSLGRRIKDKFALVAVMERAEGYGDELPVGLKNGNWDFAAFKPDGSVADKDLNACRACHAPLADSNHLFSMDHIKP